MKQLEKEKTSDTIFKLVGAMIVLLTMHATESLSYALSLMLVWNWFAVNGLSAPPLTFKYSIGMSLLILLLKFALRKDDNEDEISKDMGKLTIYLTGKLIGYTIVVVTGLLVYKFM